MQTCTGYSHKVSMPTLIEKPPTTEQPEVSTTSKSTKILPISLLIGCILTITVASLNYVTKADEEQLEALQAMIDKREPLKDYEKEAYLKELEFQKISSRQINGARIFTESRRLLNGLVPKVQR